MAPPSLDDFLSQYGAGASADQGPQPWSSGYVAPPVVAQPGTFGEPGSFSRATNPTYLEGDEWSQFVGFAPEATWQLQKKMVDAGLLKGEFHRGQWDQASAAAMQATMATANAWGVAYGTALDRLATAPQPGGTGGGQMPPRNPFMAPAYQAPTAEMLAQEVKGFVRDRLGREPDDVDMDTLTAALARAHRGDYDEQVAVERSEFGRGEDARMAEARAALAGDSASAAVGGPGEFEATGPDAVAAEFAELFERKYADEIDFNDRREARGESDHSFLGSLAAVDAMMGA